MEIASMILACMLGWLSARSNIIMVIDWSKSKTIRIRGMRFLSVIDGIILVALTLLGYAGPILLCFFLTKVLYLLVVDYESTFDQNK